MELFVEIMLGLVAIACVIPLLVLCLEVLGAFCTRPINVSSTDPTGPRIAVLVPAHNEEQGLPATLKDIVEGLRPGDRCVVIADNCEDGTALAARAFPVEVLERKNATQRGKGFALEFGVQHLRADPPDAVLVIDADCHVEPSSLHRMADRAVAAQRPIQGGDLLYPPAGASVPTRVSAFAFLFKNHVRPMGMAFWGGPCLLFGTGMAFPWSLLANVSWATSDSVEDMQFAVKLALDGKAPRYAAIPCVSGELPSAAKEARSQRQRWEHGHVRTLLKHAPRLMWQGIRRGRLDLLLLGLDLAVPPLSLLAVLIALAMLVEALGWGLTGSWIWFAIVTAAGCASGLAILLAWARFGRAMVSFKELALIPVYIAGKLPIYLRLLWRPQRTWNRTLPARQLADAEERSA